MRLFIRLPQFFRFIIAVIIPGSAAVLQLWIWPHIPALSWLLLYPAVFFTVLIGGFWLGITGTAIAAISGLYFFIPPIASWHVQDLEHGYSIAVFSVAGMLISLAWEKLNRRQAALNEANACKLKTNHEHLMLALESTHAGLWEWDLQTGLIYWTDGLDSMLEIDPDSPSSYETWLASVHADDRVSVVAKLNDFVSKGREINLEWRVANMPGNQERWLMSSGQPVFDGQGNVILYRGIILDITQRRQQEQALNEHRKRLDFALSTLGAGAWELDLKTHTAHRTLLHDQIFGYRELLPKWTFDLFITHVLPEDRDDVIQRFNTAIQTHSDWEFECRICRVDGEIHWIFAKGLMKKDTQGRPIAMAGIVQDITERKQAEAVLHEADQHKDEFLAMLAHELRNPMAPISNAVYSMKKSGMDETRRAWCLDVINRQVEHMSRLVDDLLDVSRISRGKIELKKEDLDIATIVQRAEEASLPLINARRHAFSVHLPSAPVYVKGDLVRLSQVVSNLLNNAAKYTDMDGDIKLTVERVDDEVFIRVRDNGRGIDPSALPKLFQLFYQVNRTIERSEGGLGIGLSLVKKLVTMHGGDVWACSGGSGLGSEFVIRLPCLPQTATVPTPDSKGFEPVEGSLRILVVDDNRDATQSLSLLLSSNGHKVSQAYDGYTALQTAQAERPQVVLLDIGLPGMDGFSVARAMRQHPDLKTTYLIALTGYGRQEDREQARAVGFNDYMTKPVNFDELQRVLNQVVFADNTSGLTLAGRENSDKYRAA